LIKEKKMQKKLFIMMLTSTFSLSAEAFDTITASKIFNKLFSAIIPQEVIYVYTDDRGYETVIHNAPNLHLTTDINSSNIILLTTLKEFPSHKKESILFSTSYTAFRENPDVVGAFYWKKGRIKIEFLKSRVQAKKILLPASFKPYIIDEF